MKVSIQMRPTTAELVQGFAGIPRRATDLRPVFERIVGDFRRLQQETISARRGWKPLNPAYAARKAREVGSRPPLVRTGRMIAALTGGAGFRERIDAAQLTVEIGGPAVRRGFPLWGVHHLGRGGLSRKGQGRGRVPMPSRRLIASRAVMRRRWRELLTEHFRRAAQVKA